jgi:hypothetical protein
MTARDEILAVLPAICARTADGTFTAQDVIDELRRRGSTYASSTIRTHVVSRMCANAPDHHARTYDDLERLDSGRYAAGEAGSAIGGMTEHLIFRSVAGGHERAPHTTGRAVSQPRAQGFG